MKPGSSNRSSLERVEDLAPTGVSCSITCISDITEWDTALREGTHTHSDRKHTHTGVSTTCLCCSVTSCCQSPCPASRPALSSCPPGSSASSPPSFCQSPALCTPNALTPHWRKKHNEVPPGNFYSVFLQDEFVCAPHMDSSACFLASAACSSLSFSATCACFSTSEKLLLLTF